MYVPALGEEGSEHDCPRSFQNLATKVCFGHGALNGDRLAVGAFNDDGTPDSQPDPAKTDNDFKEHQFTVSDLPPFTAFALKITLTGTNSSYPPLIKDLRGIALAV